MNKKRISHILEELEALYPDAACSLQYSQPLELLIATQLAAQCTDARVNIVAGPLFKKYPSVHAFAEADVEELERDIKSTGFYRNKARNIINCCRMLLSDFGGNVPGKMDDLLKLPGVGRKTANLILGDIFGIPSIVVDTHATRLSNRIGLSKNKDPEKIEYDLMEIIPVEKWTDFCHQLVYHGRAVCNARKPACLRCSLAPWCDFACNTGIKEGIVK